MYPSNLTNENFQTSINLIQREKQTNNLILNTFEWSLTTSSGPT
jgi:hypothetical protein